MRRILPMLRSIVSGSWTTMPALTPIVFLIWEASWAPAALASAGVVVIVLALITTSRTGKASAERTATLVAKAEEKVLVTSA